MKPPKPEPCVVSTVCSLCDEDWDAHGDDPSVLDCIRLLKAKRYTPSFAFGTGNGYRCISCGAWVYSGSWHTCNVLGPTIYTTSSASLTLKDCTFDS